MSEEILGHVSDNLNEVTAGVNGTSERKHHPLGNIVINKYVAAAAG